MKRYEILNKHDGYWISDETGYSQGPYETIKDAQQDVPAGAMLQYPLNIKFPTHIDMEPEIYDVNSDE